MSRSTHHALSPRGRGSVDDRLARLLDEPSLARVVPQLAPETLHRLVRYRGLEACTDLITASTPAQLTSLLDMDLWRHSQPGRDEQFDADRFGEWLDVLIEAGESVAARTVAALDDRLVVAGLSRYLRVFDPGTFEPTESTDDEPADRREMMHSETSADVLECEVGGYLVRARRTDAWDAIVALLSALDADHHDYFHAVMQGCRRLSNSRPEVDGLDGLLMTPEQHLHDVTVDRERRRSRHGYATPAEARAFLALARRPHAFSTHSPTNPIAAAYFREIDEDVETPPEAPGTTRERTSGRDSARVSSSVVAVIELLAEAERLQGTGRGGAGPERPVALLGSADPDPRTVRLPLLGPRLEALRHQDVARWRARGQELAFLANALQAGSSVQSRPFTPQEASDAAACTCNLGLECWPGPAPSDTFLVAHRLLEIFDVGWSVLHRDVSLFVADRLIAILDGLLCADADRAPGLAELRRQLRIQREAGTPWLARDAADVLAQLDQIAWISVLGLLDECPILPETMTAVLERRSTPVSPTAFQFFSTTAQIGDVRVFMRALPSVLSR